MKIDLYNLAFRLSVALDNEDWEIVAQVRRDINDVIKAKSCYCLKCGKKVSKGTYYCKKCR